jgi:U3 small nucleolar RNA-associated protein 3
MGKRRQTAKTGDKALYKSRTNDSSSQNKNNDDDDNMYDAVDRFHNRQDFLKLDAGGNSESESEDDGISGRQGVLNLAGGETSSSEDDESDDESVDEEIAAAVTKKQKEMAASSSSSEDDSSDSNDDDMLEDMEQSDVRDWGSKKSVYYHGDTADLEIGQDEEDAFLEEEAAKEVQAARYEQMAEDDFVMSSDEEDAINKKETRETSAKSIDMRGTRDLSKLSKSDRRRLLQSHHPELLPLVSHFKHAVEEWDGRTSVVAKAVLEGDEGTIEVSDIPIVACMKGASMIG